MTQQFVVGIDVGTEGSRAGVYALDGSAVSMASVAHDLEHIRSGWVEQHPSRWWDSASHAVRKAVLSSGVAEGSIAGVAISGTGTTVVAAKRSGEPLRSSLMWMDVRASDQASRIAGSGADVLSLSGGTASAEWFFSKTLWLAENEPDTFQAADVLCECVDWLGHRLTGVWAANLSLAAVRAYYRIDQGGWPVDLLGRIGHLDVLEKLLPTVLAPGAQLGFLTKASAGELGLPAGIPVAVSAADAEVAAIGLGAIEPGKTALITGSSHLLLGQTDLPRHGAGVFGAYDSGLLPGTFLLEGGQASTGSITRWLKNTTNGSYFGCEIDDDEAYAKLIAEAQKLAPGSDGVRVLDMWQGNRTPYVDANARGMIWGLTVGHTPAHLFRATLEGIAFGTENILKAFAEVGYFPDELVVAGGASRNPLWLQIHADVSQLPLSVSAVPDAVGLGNAMLAATAAGLFGSVGEAVAAMKQDAYRVEPNAATAPVYESLFSSYRKSYKAMRGLMAEEAQLAATRLPSARHGGSS